MVEANWSNFFILLPTFILLLIFIKLLNKTRTISNLPPSPPSFPFIGHLHLLKQPLHESLHKLSQKFGPVMLLRFGIQKVVIVTSPSIVEECFTKSNDTVFANRPMSSPSIRIINYNFTTMGTAPYGHLWRSLRRFCASELLSTTRLDATTHSREHEVKLMCRHILKESSSSPKVVELKFRFRDLLNNMTTMAVMGKRYYGDLIDIGDTESASTFREMMEEMFTILHAPKVGDFFPALRRVVDIGNIEKRSLDLMKIVNEFLEEYIQERRRIGCRGSGIMVDSMLVLQEEEPELYTDEIVKGLILILLVSGTETPYLALEWSMSLLLNNTNAMEKVKNEIDVHVGSNRLLQENDLCKLSYLQNVINESLRLYPTVPMLFPREASEDITIGGYLVPRGTTLMVNAWAIHRDPLLWDKPDEFIPERFEQNLEHKYKLIPLGVGRRGCPGANLGYRVLGLALGTLIQAFEWENIGGEEIDMTASYGLSMSKLKPLQAICKPRSNMIKHFL